MKKLGLSLFSFFIILSLLFSCNGDDENYRSFSGPQEALLFNKGTSILEVSNTTPSFIEVEVSTTTPSNVDRTFNVQVSPFSTAAPSQYSIDMSTAVIRAGNTTAKLKINSGVWASLPSLGSSVSLVLVFDSQTYALPNRNNHIVSIQRACTGTRVNFNIAFDAWGSEVGWRLSNSAGVVASAAAGTYSDGQSTHSQQFCLSPGTYTFFMVDAFGDGLSDPSPGNFFLRLTNGTVLGTGGGNYGFQSPTITFIIP